MDNEVTEDCKARTTAMWGALRHGEGKLYSELVAEMIEAGQIVETVAWLTCASLSLIERIAAMLGVDSQIIIQNWALAPLRDDADRADP